MLAVARLDDDAVLGHGVAVGIVAVCDVLDEVDVAHLTGEFADDDVVEGVPFADDVAGLDVVAFVEEELGAVGDGGRHELHAGVVVDDTHFCESAYDYAAADVGCAVFACGAFEVDGAEFVNLELAFVLGGELRGGRYVGCHTTDVECTEGKLCTGLADGLSCDDADGLAFLDHAEVGEVAAVALGADTALALAGEDRTDLDALDGRCVDAVGSGVLDFLAGSDDELAGLRVDDVVDGHTAEDALAQGSDDFVVVLDGGADKAAEGAAVLFVDDDVVGHVDETTCEVTGVGSLEGGIGKTLTGTVGRDEVLKHRQTLLEVRKNRVLDDLTTFGTALLRFRHKTTHTGELTDLVLRTTRT